MWQNLKPLNLSKINTINFPENQFFREEFPKRQIVIHHTVSGPNINGDIQTWKQSPQQIGTCIIIDHSGIPHQVFSSRFWAFHLGVRNRNLDRHSIGIELDNWGPLFLGDGTSRRFGTTVGGKPNMVRMIKGRFYGYYGNLLNENIDVIEYPQLYGGYRFFERYSIPQLQTLGELLLFWKNRFNIPLHYNEDMWDVSKRALSGAPGVWGHVSYRPKPGKTDPHPQPELIEMLKSLENIKL